MKSSSSSFETILEALLKQKQLLQDLRAENEALHRQLADLRAGRGILLEILGTRIALASAAEAQDQEVDIHSHGNSAFAETIEDTRPVAAVVAAQKDTPQPGIAEYPATKADPALQPTTAFTAANNDLTLQPTTGIPGEFLQSWGHEKSSTGDNFLIEDVSEQEAPMPAPVSSNFLTETLLAEFSAASTRYAGNWSGPNSNGPITNNPILDEEEKAALRRELMGSYILE